MNRFLALFLLFAVLVASLTASDHEYGYENETIRCNTPVDEFETEAPVNVLNLDELYYTLNDDDYDGSEAEIVLAPPPPETTGRIMTTRKRTCSANNTYVFDSDTDERNDSDSTPEENWDGFTFCGTDQLFSSSESTPERRDSDESLNIRIDSGRKFDPRRQFKTRSRSWTSSVEVMPAFEEVDEQNSEESEFQ